MLAQRIGQASELSCIVSHEGHDEVLNAQVFEGRQRVSQASAGADTVKEEQWDVSVSVQVSQVCHLRKASPGRL